MEYKLYILLKVSFFPRADVEIKHFFGEFKHYALVFQVCRNVQDLDPCCPNYVEKADENQASYRIIKRSAP